jgi:hypothetical protein
MYDHDRFPHAPVVSMYDHDRFPHAPVVSIYDHDRFPHAPVVFPNGDDRLTKLHVTNADAHVFSKGAGTSSQRSPSSIG